jgi:ubiquinone/menaquinone biosynthesis C-methylase UbiE
MTTQALEQTRAAWDSIAGGYDRFVTPRWELSETALDRARLGPGMRFLDVASGSGALSIPAARRGADVLATDLSPVMIERLIARAGAERLSKIEARVMDGHNLELNDDTFDVTGSQFGVMLFPDQPRGLREMTRVTKPGGRVLMVVYGPPPKVGFLAFFLGAMKAVVPGFAGLPTDPPPLPFQTADPEVLRRRMTEAGLSGVRVEQGSELLEFTSGRHMWDWVTNSNPIAVGMVGGLTGQQKTEVQEVLDGMLRERSGGKGAATLDNLVNIAVGTKQQPTAA